MRKIYLLFLMLLLPWMHNAQINYSYGWEPTGLGNWVSSGSASMGRTTTAPCEGTASVRTNFYLDWDWYYYYYDNIFRSPSLGTSNQGLVTVNLSYKVINYSSTATPASYFKIKMQWANATTGPWNDFYEINSSNHTASTACNTVTATFYPLAGDTYVRFVSEDLSDGYGDYYIYYDNVNITQGPTPTCFVPNNGVLTNVSSSSAEFNWSAPSTAPSNGYQYEIRTDTNPGISGPALVAQGTTLPGVLNANVSTLAPSTFYNVYIRSNCNADGFSDWVKLLSFNTLCSSQNIPYLMPIDATTGNALPECVTIQNLNNDSSFWYSDATVSGFTERVMRYTYNVSQAANDWFYTKGLNLIQGQSYRLKFKFKTSSASAVEKLKVMLGTNPLSDSMQTQLFNITTTSANATVEYTIVDFVPTTTGVYYIGFQCYSAANQYTLFVGEVSVDLSPTCLVPENLQIVNMTKYGGRIQWQAPVAQPQNGYEYEIRTSGEPGSGTVGLAQTGTLPNSDLFKNVTGLLPLTQYSVYVRSVCIGTDVSVWTPVKTFKTLCDYPELTSVTPGTRCGIGTVDLSAASNSGQLKWFSSSTSTLPIFTGNVFTTPIIDGTTSYWVSNYSSSQVLGSGGIAANTSTSSSSLTNYGLVFDLTQNVLLKSTKVYRTTTTASGTISVKILNSSGVEVFNTGLITLTQTGGTTPIEIPLNVNLPSGNGYRILLNSFTSSELVRLSSGVTYPYVDANGVLNVTSGATSTTSVSATSYYYFFDLQYDATCSSPRTEVVATVTPAPALTLSTNSVEICEGQTSTVTVTDGVANYDSYVWSPSTGVTGNEITGWTFNPIVSTIYTLTASQTTGSLCAQVIDVDFTVNPLPGFTPINSNFDICVDEIKELNPALVTNMEVIVGTSTTTTSTTDAQTAFMNRFAATKQQYIYTKEELNALGFYSGPITGIAFDITSAGSSTSNTDYTIKMKSISESGFANSTFLTGGFTTVFGPSTYTHTATGWQMINFSTPFVWDGTSNILIELTHLGVDTTNNAETKYSVTNVNRGLATQSSTASTTLNATTGTLTTRRLNTKFIVEGIASGSWSPVTNLYSNALATVPYAGENISKVYVKGNVPGSETYTFDMVSYLGCETSLSTTVNVIDVAAPIVSNQSICSPEVSNIVVTGLQTGGALKWYETLVSPDEITTISETGTYYVEQVVGTCKSERVSALITLNLQLAVPSAPAEQKFCLDTTNTSFTVANLTATPTTGTIGWFLNEADETPLALTTVLVTGNYYVAQFNGTCWSDKALVDVAIGTMPAVPNGASQAFCSSLTLGDVEVGQVPGATVNWYATQNATETLDLDNVLTDATYYVSQIIGFCESERVAIQIQLISVFDAPVAPSPILYCQETTFDDLEVTLLPGGSKGWFTSIATAVPNIALTDIVTTGTYYVAQFNGACWSNKTPVVVTVNPKPASLNATAQTLCGTFTLADAQLGQATNAIVKFYTSASSDVVLPMTTPLVTGSYYVSQTVGGCESDRVTVQFTVYEILGAPTAPAVQFYCGPQTFADLAATPTTGTIGWFATESATTPLSGTATVSTGVYYVAQVNGTCWSEKVAVTVSVNPIPASLNNAAQQLCGTFTLADAEFGQADNAVVLFYANANSVDALPSTTPLLTGTYYVSQMVLGCESPRVAVSFVVNAILVAPQAPASQLFCGSATISDLAATPTTGTIGWFATENAITPLSGTASVSTGTYYVAQLNGQCWSEKVAVAVTVNPIPASLNNAAQQLCGTFTLADAVLGQANNATLKFYQSGTSTVVLPLTSSLVTGTYYVSQTVAGCESPRVTVDFVVNEILAAPQAPSVQAYCGTTTFADLVATPTTGTIGWFATENATTPLSATASVSTGVYYVAQLNGACWSPKKMVNVTVNAVPVAPSNADLQLCGNYNFGQISIGQISGATLKWYETSTSVTPLNASTNVVSGTYYVSQTVGGCESARAMVTITQTDALSNPTAVSQTFCGSATVADLVAQGSVGATLVWYNSSVALNPLSPNTALTTGTYYVAQTRNGCFSGRVPISVFVVSVAGPNVDTFNFCGSAKVSDLVLPTPTGVVYKWFNSPSSTTQLDANTSLVSGTYFVSRTQYGCESIRSAVTVNINSVPDAPTGVSPQTFIQGSTINDIVMNQPNVVWYITEQNARNGVNPLVQGMPLVNGTTYYGVLIGTNGCPSLPFALTVDVYLSDDKFVKEDLKYYPNPVEDLLTISYSDRILQIEVFDLLGKRVKAQSTDDKEVKIDLSDLASGTYMIQLKTENKSQFLKIIKK